MTLVHQTSKLLDFNFSSVFSLVTLYTYMKITDLTCDEKYILDRWLRMKSVYHQNNRNFVGGRGTDLFFFSNLFLKHNLHFSAVCFIFPITVLVFALMSFFNLLKHVISRDRHTRPISFVCAQEPWAGILSCKTVPNYLKFCCRNTVSWILEYKKNNITLLENTAYPCKWINKRIPAQVSWAQTNPIGLVSVLLALCYLISFSRRFETSCKAFGFKW